MSKQDEKTSEPKACFIIMPISDVDGYEPGHFKRVYDYIIKPACTAAGYTPLRADDVQSTNYIVIDILKRIITAEMVICDLSSRNANVLYELGLRHAFNLPVTLIKDSITTRVFDIQGLRDIEYDASLRIDSVESAKSLLETTLKNTSKLKKEDVNSIVQLLGITSATLPNVEITPDTGLLLKAINDLGERISRVEISPSVKTTSPPFNPLEKQSLVVFFDMYGRQFTKNSVVRHPEFGDGIILGMTSDYLYVKFKGDRIATFTLQGALEQLSVI